MFLKCPLVLCHHCACRWPTTYFCYAISRHSTEYNFRRDFIELSLDVNHFKYVPSNHMLQFKMSRKILWVLSIFQVFTVCWFSNIVMVPFLPDTYTVGTPYNTVPYTTGSNIARLGHGSQNSWSKLWIPVVKEILNRFPSVLLSREKASPQENSR